MATMIDVFDHLLDWVYSFIRMYSLPLLQIPDQHLAATNLALSLSGKRIESS
jgi:hypothetical protein